MANDNQLNLSVVNPEDILKASYEENADVIISVTDDASSKEEVLKAISNNYSNLIINDGNISFADEDGKKWIIKALHFYTTDSSGKIVTLTDEEVEVLLKNNTHYTPLLISEKKISDGTVSSDLNLVTESTSSIVGYIDDKGELSYVSEAGEAGLIGAMYNVIDYFKTINGKINADIAAEADAINTIGEAYDALDRAASNQAQSSFGSSGFSTGGHSGHSGNYNSGNNSKTLNGMSASEVSSHYTKLIDDAKSAALSTKYSDISSFLGNNIQAGKIGKMSVGKLDESLSKLTSILTEDANNSTKTISSIDDLISNIGSNNKLRGNSWNNAKKNLELYKSLLNASVDSSNFLSDVLKSAKKMITDFLYPDNELDDSILPELEKTYKELVEQISELNAKVASMKASQKDVCTYESLVDSEGLPYSRLKECHKEPSDADIAAVQTTINQYQEQADEVKKKIDKINDFAVVVNNAQKLINDATSQVKSTFESPVKNASGNDEFRAKFALDLSAYGITAGSELGNMLSKYIKGREDNDKDQAKEENSKRNTIKVGDYEFDTSKMSAKAKSVLNTILKSWPENLEKQRITAIQTALSLMNKGITYSMPRRWAKDKNGNPLSMDCSSFVTYCLRSAGMTINARKNVYTGSYLDSKINDYVSVKRSNLLPGDVGLYSTTTKDGGANHIGMYIGKDENGKEMWIEMSAIRNGIIVKHGDRGNGHCGFEVTRRYTAYK